MLFGTLLAYYWAYERPRLTATVRRLSWPLAAVSVLLLSPSLLLPLKDGFVVNTIGLTANYLGLGGLVILAVVTSQQDGGWLGRALTPKARLGFYSYFIYLWHSPVSYLTARSLPPVIGWPATIAVYSAGSVLVGGPHGETDRGSVSPPARSSAALASGCSAHRCGGPDPFRPSRSARRAPDGSP